jgi:hypothetical protein
MASRDAFDQTVESFRDIAAPIEPLEKMPPLEAAALQRSRSLICCMQFRTWMRNGRETVRGISLKDALKREQHLLLWIRHFRKTAQG